MEERLKRERDFHDQLAAQQFRARRLLNKMAQVFYDKQIIWMDVWNEIGDLNSKVVLDYGCGTGGFSFELAKRGAKVYGIDISQEAIAFAKLQEVPSNMQSPEFLLMDAHRTGFQSNSFDFVFGNGILHHLELEKAFSEIKRILKPGGIGYFMEPLDKHPAVRIIRSVTPKARSKDEKPLNFSDICLARKFFKKVTHKEYFLISVAAAPMHLINIRLARLAVRFLHLVDQAIFRMMPWTRRLAWITLIKLEK